MEKVHAVRFPPRKILVPLDLSDASMAAWGQALWLARRFAAKVEGLYVQPWVYSEFGPYSGTSIPEPAVTSQATQQALSELRSRLGPDAVLSAVPGAAIVPTILSWGKKYDMIVMGTHERTGFERVVQGSIAEAITRHAMIPVLVARGRPVDFRSVLVPVNFEPYAMAGLRTAGEVAKTLGARLTVLHVIDSSFYGGAETVQGPKELLADAVRTLAEDVRRTCRPRTRLAFGKPAEQIVAATEPGALIVLVAHRKGFLQDMLLGTTVERVLRHAAQPVLAIPSGPAIRKIKRRTSEIAGRHAAVALR